MVIIEDTTPTKQGYRTRLTYTIDNQNIALGPFNVTSLAELEALKIAKEQAAILLKLKYDVEEAMATEIVGAHKTATVADVLRGYMAMGIDESNTIQAYKILSKVADVILALGLTDAQYASQFNTTEKQVVTLKARWQHLKDNEASILSYSTVVDGDNY